MKQNTRLTILVFSVVVIVLGFLALFRVKSDFSLDQFASDKALREYKKYETFFNSGTGGIILLINSKKKFDSYHQFEQLQQTCFEIEKVEVIEKVDFLTSLRFPFRKGIKIDTSYFLPLNKRELFEKRLGAIDTYIDVKTKFLSNDHKKVAIYIRPHKTLENEEIGIIASIVSSNGFKDHAFIGRQHFENTINKKLERDIIKLTLLSLVLILIAFFLFIRSLRALLFFAWNILLIVGTYFVLLYTLNITINPLTVSIPLLLVVLSLSDCMHILFTSQELGSSWTSQNLFDRIGRSLIYTSITTILGFVVFLFTGSPLVIEFSLLAALGLVLAYVVARFFSPLLFFLILDQQIGIPLDNILKRIIGFTTKYSAFTTIAGIAVLAFCALFSYQKLTIDQPLYGQQFPDSPATKALKTFDEEFGGLRRVSIFLSSDESLVHPQTVKLCASIESFLEEKESAITINSLNTAIKRYNRYKHKGRPQDYSIPDQIDNELLQKVLDHRDKLGLSSVVSKEGKQLKMVVTFRDQGSNSALKQIDRIKEYVEQKVPENITFYIGGPSTIQDQSTTRITRYIIYGIIGAIVLIALFLITLYKSIRIGIIGLIANALPMAIVLGLFVLLGEKLYPTNVMLLSITLGVAVDDTIYLLTRYTSIQSEEDNINTAIRTVGRPVIVTSLMLMIGFAALLFSSFESNQTSGLFFIIGVFAALLADLIFIPSALRILSKKLS